MMWKLRDLLARWPFSAGKARKEAGEAVARGPAAGESAGASGATTMDGGRALLQSVIDNCATVIYVKDLEGRYLLINSRFEELFHIDRGSVAGKTDYDLFPADRASAFRAFDQRVAAAGAALEEEELVPQDDGLHTYISVKCPIRDSAGRIWAICGISTDITERKRIEDSQRESEEKYRSLYDNTPVMMHSIDRDGRLLSVSNRWLETLGYKREEVIGRRSVEFLTPQSRQFAKEVVLPEFFRSGRCQDIPYDFVTKSGAIINVRLSAIGERDSTGSIIKSLAVLTDVTERIRAEETVHRLAAIVESSGDAIISITPDRVVTSWNRGAEKIYGYRSDEMVGRPVGPTIPPDRVEETGAVIARALSGEAVDEFETERLRKDGSTVPIALIVSPVKDANGAVAGISLIGRDISIRKTIERALRHSEQRFRDFAETESDWLWETGRDHRMTWMTARPGTSGVAPTNRVGKRRWEYAVDVEDEPEKWRQHRAALDRREPFRDFVFKLRNPQDVERYVSASGKPVFAPDGTFVGYRGVGRDVTDAVLAERALREGEERLELAIEAGDMGTWDYDLRRAVMHWSPRLSEMFGFPEPRSSANLEESLTYVHPEDRPSVVQTLASALETKGKVRHEFRINSPGGDRWLVSHGIVVTDDAGRPVRMVGVVRDITVRKLAEQRQKLLLDELNHRVKNTLLTVQSVAMQMAREAGSPELFYQAFKARLIALSNAHDLLTRSAWKGASLQELLQQTVAPYAEHGEQRVSMSGPAISLKPNVAVGLAMAFQELATNAAKHGALSAAGGRVAVDWRYDPPGSGIVEIRWSECGGPAVTPPRRRGFGSRLLERGLAYEFKAEVRLDFAPDGLRCVIRLPL